MRMGGIYRWEDSREVNIGGWVLLYAGGDTGGGPVWRERTGARTEAPCHRVGEKSGCDRLGGVSGLVRPGTSRVRQPCFM